MRRWLLIPTAAMLVCLSAPAQAAQVGLIKIDGAIAQVTVSGVRGSLHGGKLRIFAEDKSGARREIGSWAAADVATGQGVSVSIPAGTRLLAAVLRGQDDAGVLVAAGEQLASAN